jgi:hypothetical protein
MVEGTGEARSNPRHVATLSRGHRVANVAAIGFLAFAGLVLIVAWVTSSGSLASRGVGLALIGVGIAMGALASRMRHEGHLWKFGRPETRAGRVLGLTPVVLFAVLSGAWGLALALGA